MLLGLACFLGVVAVAQQKAQDKVQNMMQKSQQVAGRAAVGGPFTLIDFNGKPFTQDKLLDHFSIMYFGFTHCPDICPDELEKLAEAIDLVEKQVGVQVQPIFVSVDPARDTPARIKAYCKEFHPRLMGLTGSEEAVKAVSKAYRVYFHKTSDDDKDYLVDHSIIMYLMDPAGEFLTFYGKNFTAQQLADSICQHIANWKQQGAGGSSSSRSNSGSKAAAAMGAGSQEGKAQR
jgi:protein SCO1/2